MTWDFVGQDLDQLAGTDSAGRHGVEVAVEGDQAVLADVPQLPFGHQIRDRGQRFESRVVSRRPLRDDLSVGLVDLSPPHGHPGGECGVHFLDGGEGPAGQDVVADDQHLSLDAAFALRAVGGQHVDVEVVVAGERRTTVLVRS
jgi:hypothetical protein